MQRGVLHLSLTAGVLLQAGVLSFDAWENVLKVAHREPIEAVRVAFNEFLSKFPLCYGYWGQVRFLLLPPCEAHPCLPHSARSLPRWSSC